MLRSSHVFEDEEEGDDRDAGSINDPCVQDSEFEACDDEDICNRVWIECHRFTTRLIHIDKASMKVISLLALVIFVIMQICRSSREAVVEPKSIAKLQEHSGMKIKAADEAQRSVRSYGWENAVFHLYNPLSPSRFGEEKQSNVAHRVQFRNATTNMAETGYQSDSPLPISLHEQMYATTNAFLEARVRESPDSSFRTQESSQQGVTQQQLAWLASQEQQLFLQEQELINHHSKGQANAIKDPSDPYLSVPDLVPNTEKSDEFSSSNQLAPFDKAGNVISVQTQEKPGVENMVSTVGYDRESAMPNHIDSISIRDSNLHFSRENDKFESPMNYETKAYPDFERSQQNSEAMGFTGASELNYNPIHDIGTNLENGMGIESHFTSNSLQVSFANLQNFRDNSYPFNSNDIPMYFHIPKAGGSTVKDVIGSCFRVVMASEFGVTDGHDTDKEIAVVYPKVLGGTGVEERSPFVNVDVTTASGIERAVRMGFAESGLAGLVASPLLYEANKLFAVNAQGRLFAIFRHPVDRAVSMFYYVQVASWEPSYMPELQSWTLEKYATSSVIENNWITRQLSKEPFAELSESHLKYAIEVVKHKFLVGLLSKLEESMSRFEKFFRWKYHVNPIVQEACREHLIGRGANSNSKNIKERPIPGDPLWDLIAKQNVYDIKLYQYIESLYELQESIFRGIPDNYRSIESTCCQCSTATYPPEGFSCPKRVIR